MRLGPLELRRRTTVTAAAEPTPAPHQAAGASGTVNLSGFLQPDDERNHELRFPHSLRTFDRMHRTDGAVREAYLHTIAPILNATWTVEPGGQEPGDLEVAEFVRCAYFDWPTTPFMTMLQLTLRYLRQGFQLFEVTEKVITAGLEYGVADAADPTTVDARQFLTWDRFEHRRPETVWKWDTKDGQLVNVVQWAFKDGDFGMWTMPAENLALFVNEQEGDDYTGFSVLRPAYKSWKLKELVERVAAMSVETHGVGLRAVYLPSEAKSDSTMVDNVEAQMETLRAGESNFIIFPGPRQQTAATNGGASDGYLLEIVAPPGGLPDFVPFLNYLRGDIKGAVLARFSELGHGHTGARATSDSQSEVWYDALVAVANYVSSVHDTLIQRLVDKNYPGVTKYPKLVASGIEAKSLAEFAQANAQLVAAGAMTLDRSYRAYVRDGIQAPPEDDPEKADLEHQPVPPTEPLNDLTTKPPADAGGDPTDE